MTMVEEKADTTQDENGSWLKERSELGVSLLLLALGMVLLIDTMSMNDLPTTQNGSIGPKSVPTVLGIGLVVCALLHAIDVLRGGRGEAEGGEDIDLTTKPDYRAVIQLVAVFLASAALIEPAGWVLASTLLFWGTTHALGSRRYLRDVGIAATMALASFYAFLYGLGMTLPLGVLEGIL